MIFPGKLRASLSPLFYGENGILSGTSKLVFLTRFNGQVKNSNCTRFTSPFPEGRESSLRSRGIRLLYHRLHSSVHDDFSELDEIKPEDTEGVDKPEQQKFSCLEDDIWSELGSVKRNKIVIPKLMTEKPEPLKKANGKRKASAQATLFAKNILNLKDLSSKSSSSSTTGHKPKAHDSSSSSITVSNAPSSVQHSQLRLAMSTFGKISKISSSRKQYGSDIYEIDFEDVESRKRALAAGHVRLKNANLEVRPGETRHVVRIRISNLNLETADSAIHSKCMSFGSLEGLARVDNGTVDALFRVRDSSEAESVQDKLNNTTVDDFQWLAKLQSRIPTAAALVSGAEASQDQMGLRIKRCTDDLLIQISMLKVHVEDLETLLHSILHLENHPIANRD